MVQPIAVEIFVRLDKINWHAVVIGRMRRAPLFSIAHPHPQRAKCRMQAMSLIIHHRIARQDDDHLVSQGLQRRRQRPNHVGQTARLGIRHTL